MAEGKTAGDEVGDPYTAVDPDGDTVTYTLEGVDAGVLSVGQTTGQIAVGAGYSLDFENPVDNNTDNIYIIEVVADDGHGLIVRMDLEITVTDIDEPGSLIISVSQPPSRFGVGRHAKRSRRQPGHSNLAVATGGHSSQPSLDQYQRGHVRNIHRRWR